MPRRDALLLLARQAGISLGFTPDARCGGRVGLKGRMTLDEALTRLLYGSDCVAFRPEPGAVVIRPAPPPRPAASRAEPNVPAPGVLAAPTAVAELVVTADRSQRLLSMTAGGLTAIGQDSLSRAGIVDARDLDLMAAGVTVTNLGPGRDKILLRGLSDGPLAGSAQSMVALFLGELRLTYNAPDPDLPLADLSRVEVLRGPQGSLYGAGSMGGVIHYAPNAPDLAATAASVTAHLGVSADAGADSGALVMVNQPLSGAAAAVRAVGWTEIQGGAIEDVGRGLSHVDRSRRRGFRASALARPSADLELEVMAVAQSIDNRDAQYADPAIGALARSSAVAQPHDNDFRALTLTGRWWPAWGQATATVGLIDHAAGTIADASLAGAELTAGADPYRLRDRNHVRSATGELRAASGGDFLWRWSVGLFAALTEQDRRSELETRPLGRGYGERREDRLDEAAAFGEVGLTPWRNVSLTIGGRLFAVRQAARSEVAVGSGRRGFAGTNLSGGVAPRLVLGWRPRPGLTLYALAAEGYRAPGFNTAGPLGQTFASRGDDQPLRLYRDDELWNVEAGGRWTSPALGLSVRAAAFQADWKRAQAESLLPSGLPFTARLGDARSRGFELEASWAWRGAELNAALVRQDPRLAGKRSGPLRDRDVDLPGVPDLAFAVGAAYGFKVAGAWDVDLRTAYAYGGRSRLALGRATDPAMGGVGDLKASLTLNSPALTVRVSADNLLDGHADTLSFGNPFLAGVRPVTTPQRPRLIGLSVTRRF